MEKRKEPEIWGQIWSRNVREKQHNHSADQEGDRNRVMEIKALDKIGQNH